ncbi:MAG TPA: DUF5723 family protein, partial [Bacteroidales bacterium]|nr:DUF5723 family protein [Bacteroidales bacterium]
PPVLEALSAGGDLSAYHPENYPFWHRYGPGHNDLSKQVYAYAALAGPSFFLSMGRQAVAFGSGHRSWMMVRDFPYHLAKFMYEGVDFAPQQGIDYTVRDARLVFAGALDLSFSYALVVMAEDHNLLGLGITYHHLVPTYGVFLGIDAMDYRVPSDSQLTVRSLEASWGYSLPMNYVNNDLTTDFGLDQGSGMAVDVGMSYYFLKKRVRKNMFSDPRPCNNGFEDYTLRLGVSVMDVGRLRYLNNALVHEVGGQGTDWHGVDTVEFRNVLYFNQLLSTRFYGVPNRSVRDYAFTVYTPAVFSFQADASLGKGLYFQTLFLHPIRLGDPWIRHPVMLYAMPRFESRFFEAGLPMSLYDFTRLHAGLYFRIGWLTLGSDDLGLLFSPRNFDSGGLYAGIRINLLPGRCGQASMLPRGRSSMMNSIGRMKRGRHVPCEAYW